MDENFLRELKKLQVPFNTPDRLKLESYAGHLLFDPGKLRVTDAVCCSAYSVERMSLFLRSGDDLPIPIKMPRQHKARIGGTMYKVSADDLVKLDKKYQNRLLFERKEVSVIVPYLDEEGQLSVLPNKVWFYSAIVDQWGEQIEMSQPKYNFRPKEAQFKLARTYVDNYRILNNHFRVNDKRLEDYMALLTPSTVSSTPEVAAYVRAKNEFAVKGKPKWRKMLAL